MHGRHSRQRRPCRFRADCQWPLRLTNALPIHARPLLQQIALCCNAACTALQQAVLCCSGGPSGVKPADRARPTSNGADSGRGARRLESYLPAASRRSAALGCGNHAATTRQPCDHHAATTRGRSHRAHCGACAACAGPSAARRLLHVATSHHLARRNAGCCNVACAVRHAPLIASASERTLPTLAAVDHLLSVWRSPLSASTTSTARCAIHHAYCSRSRPQPRNEPMNEPPVRSAGRDQVARRPSAATAAPLPRRAYSRRQAPH